MTQSRTHTQTGTQTSTKEKVLFVTRKMQADLLAIIDTYGVLHGDRDYGLRIIGDLRVMLEEGVLEWVEFVWTVRGTSTVLESIRYSAAWGGVEVTDSRSGGIGYNPLLKGANFEVRYEYSAYWNQLGAEARADILRQMKTGWVDCARLDYSTGNWNADRSYAKEDLSLTRERFTRP